MNAGLVVCLVGGRRFQLGNDVLRLLLALVGSLARHLHQLERLPHAAHDESRVVESHHDETAKLPVGLRREAQLRGDGKLVGGRLLQQQVGHFPEVLPALAQLVGVDAEGAEGCGHAELLVVVGMPLPLKPHRGRVELIALNGVDDGHSGGGFRLLVARHRLTLLAHDGPAARPVDGLQVDHTPVGLLVLEVQKPVLAILRVYPAALMGAVDAGLALRQHDLMLVGAVRAFTAHGQLETRGHAACRTHDPVPAVALVEFRTLTGAVLCAVAVEHDDRLADGPCAVSTQFTDGQHRSELSARVGPAVHQVAAAVVVPEWGSVDVALALDDAQGLRPLAGRVFRLHHHYAVVGVAPVDVVFAVVVAYGGCPDAVAVLRPVEL